ncbi:LRR receptor-like serine/threonine-protein kinase ERECTA [Euphorbia lathyris]|uniref:LRR receptor-like serine/threonine-protein kinase ERECTA n=1 Tax=Euphorbia lathyris TaxID=212925 RepID=UPI0033134B6D
MPTLTFSLSSFILPVIILLTFSLSLNVESKTYWADTQYLKHFKNGIEPSSVNPGSCLSSWDFSVDPCDNLFTDKFTCGFRCDALVSGFTRVTELTLDQAGYSASFSSITPFNLPFLQILDLSNNNFYGPIDSSSFSNLTRLTRLALSGNWAAGQIPSSISSLVSLEELYLDNNILQGTIPPSFDSLISLKRLEIQSNKLFGEFPELGSLQNLFFLDASNNAFSGLVPSSLPSSLVQISMRDNSLTGTIPEDFKNLINLQVVDLSHNKLTGLIPSLLFTHPSLQQLTLSFNSFNSVQSPLPTYFSSPATVIQNELIALDLSNNGIEGFIPSFLALMPKLSALSLENNKLTGMIPTQFAIKAAVSGGEVSAFARLLLGGNYLFGPIPVPLMELKPGSVDVRLYDNCLYRCPVAFFFCQGGNQKSLMECKSFSPFIP